MLGEAKKKKREGGEGRRIERELRGGGG